MLVNLIKFKLKNKKRIGRDGKKGNYSGRGMKGQKARAGRRIRPAQRDVILKFPKLRGVKFKSIKSKPIVINLDKIDKKFNEGERVDYQILNERKIVKIPKSKKNIKIKILGKGELNKKLIFSNKFLFSQSALKKIKEKNCEIVND